MEKQIIDIELRSEKVRNIIGKIPPLLIRSGISLMTFIIVALLFAGWFISYPESLNVPVEIKSNKKQAFHAIAYVPYSYITLLKNGMSVDMEMEGYNVRNYGYIKGCISRIDRNIIKRDEENYFTVIIQLNHSNTKIEIAGEMKGHAFILISNESILKHIFKINRY
jgi:hypothetical protein